MIFSIYSKPHHKNMSVGCAYLNKHECGCAYLSVTHSFVHILTWHFMFDALLPTQIMNISRGQRQVIHQLDNLTNLLHEHLVLTRQANTASRNRVLDIDTVICPLICPTVASIGYFMFKGLNRGWPKWVGSNMCSEAHHLV